MTVPESNQGLLECRMIRKELWNRVSYLWLIDNSAVLWEPCCLSDKQVWQTSTLSNAKPKSCFRCGSDIYLANDNKCRAKGAECDWKLHKILQINWCRERGAKDEGCTADVPRYRWVPQWRPVPAPLESRLKQKLKKWYMKMWLTKQVEFPGYHQYTLFTKEMVRKKSTIPIKKNCVIMLIGDEGLNIMVSWLETLYLRQTWSMGSWPPTSVGITVILKQRGNGTFEQHFLLHFSTDQWLLKHSQQFPC